MKKFLLVTGIVLVTNIANAKVEYYAAAKAGAGDMTIYVNSDDKFGDSLVKAVEDIEHVTGYKYSDSGFLWEVSGAMGLDWSPGAMYVKKNPYDWFHLRLEGEFGYTNYHENGKLRYNYAIKDKIRFRYNHFFALANGYADFRIDRFVPYIGFGVGYSFGNEETKINGDHEYSNSVDDDGMIYAAHLGLGYKYSDITTLDLGVRRVWAPAEDDGMYIFDTIRLGARFRI